MIEVRDIGTFGTRRPINRRNQQENVNGEESEREGKGQKEMAQPVLM